MPAISYVGSTGDPYVDGVLSGIKWAGTSLTFSFPASASYYGSGYGDGEPQDGFQVANANQQTAIREVLAGYTAVTGLTFTEMTETSSSHADMRFAQSDMPSTAWAYYPSTWAEGGDTWFGAHGYYDNPTRGNYAYSTVLHEIGHALGLKHTHDSDGGGAMPAHRDSKEFSVMSYNSYVGATEDGYVNRS